MAAGLFAQLIRLREFARRVGREIYADDVTGLAAEMSYYFVLSVFPFLIFLAALVGTLPFTGTWGKVLEWIMVYFPRESQRMVYETVLSLTQGRKGFLSLGLLGTAWAASGGFMSLMGALNRVYRVRETRSFPKRLGLASLMILVLAVLLLTTFGLLTAGDWFDYWLALYSTGPIAVPVLWRATRGIVSVFLLGMCIAVLDHTMPNLRRPWRSIAPGVVFITIGWLLSTAGFNFYAEYMGTFNRTYGVLGVFVILMVWIYLLSLTVLAGAEINSELSNMTIGKGAPLQAGVTLEPPANS